MAKMLMTAAWYKSLTILFYPFYSLLHFKLMFLGLVNCSFISLVNRSFFKSFLELVNAITKNAPMDTMTPVL